MTIALGSIDETENHLGEALEAKYIGPEEHVELLVLVKRARMASLGLLRYLERCAERKHGQRRRPPEPGPNL